MGARPDVEEVNKLPQVSTAAFTGRPEPDPEVTPGDREGHGREGGFIYITGVTSCVYHAATNGRHGDGQS